MGGLFGIVSKKDCTTDLFYGTDYHSHLGTERGGMAVKNSVTNVRRDSYFGGFVAYAP